MIVGTGRGQIFLYVAVGEHLEGVRIEQLEEVAILLLHRVLDGEESVVEAYLGLECMRGRHPMDGALDATVTFGHTGLCLRIIFGIDLRHLARFVLLATGAADDVGAAQTHLLTGREAIVILRSLLHEVLALDIEFAGEGDRVCAFGEVLRVVDGLHHLDLPLGIVGDDELHGVEHSGYTAGGGVQILAHGMFKQGYVDDAVVLRVADHVHEIADRGGGEAAAAIATDGRHAGVVPTVDAVLLDELQQFALAHDGVGQVEAIELRLTGAVIVLGLEGAFDEAVDEVVVERAVHLELERAERVGDTLEIVALAVGKVVHGVDVPGAAGAMVRRFDDAIDDRIAEVHIGRCHVDFGAEGHGAFVELAAVHAQEEVSTLRRGTVAEGAFAAGYSGRSLLLGDGLGRLFIHISMTVIDEPEGKLKELTEIVGGVIDVFPAEAEPLDVLLDGVDILDVFFDGIGVVEAQVARAAILTGDAEVEADGLGVTDV